MNPVNVQAVSETKATTVIELSKSQRVRVWDFLFFGPFLIYVALKRKKITKADRVGLGLLGAGVIYYNFIRWNKNR
jgi:hypothetical protein